MLIGSFSGKKKAAKVPVQDRRQEPLPGPCPEVGAAIVRRDMVMKISEPISPALWEWLVRLGWREVKLSTNRRQYHRAPSGTFARLASAAPEQRELIYPTINSLKGPSK